MQANNHKHRGPDYMSAKSNDNNSHSKTQDARLELQITDFLMASACDMLERHLAKLPGLKQLRLNRVNGYLCIDYDPNVLEPQAVIAEIASCGFHCELCAYNSFKTAVFIKER